MSQPAGVPLEPSIVEMSRQVTPRFVIVTGAGVAGSVAAILTSTPSLAVVTVALLAWSLIGVLTHDWPELEIVVSTSHDRVVEGDHVEVAVEVFAHTAVDWLELSLDTPADLPPVDGIGRSIVSVPALHRLLVRFDLAAPKWGVASPQRIRLTARDRYGLFVSRRVIGLELPVRIHPRDRTLDTMIRSTRTRARVGHHLAAQRGDGCEYADVRPWAPGDRWRSVNWRVTARRGQPWVSDRHPERASDILLLVDSSQGLGKGDGSTLHAAIRAGIALTEGHLATHDRVGLLDVGRDIRWFQPAMGRIQLRRLIDALLDTHGELGLGARRAADLPLRGMDTAATVVALTPLLDPAPVELLIDLAAHGHDVAVIVCEPDIDRIHPANDISGALARRLWRLERTLWRTRLDDAGVPVVSWSDDESLNAVIALLDRRRRTMADSR